MNTKPRAYLRAAGYFLISLISSVCIAVPSMLVMFGRLVRCMMSLGCQGVPSSTSETLASYGLYAPYLIFALGAFFAHRRLTAASIRKAVRIPIITAFLIFPVLAYASLPLVLRGIELVREKASEPDRRRLEELERKLKSAPIVVEIKEARLDSYAETEGFIDLTIVVRNVPTFLKYYELNIHGVEDDEHYYIGRGGEDYFKVVNEGGNWDFRSYETGESHTSAQDTFTTRIQYLKPARLPVPSKILLRLAVRARDDKVYTRDCIFFYGWVKLPLSALDDTP